MACHEVAALRLGLMNVIGGYDESERSHERSELGDAAEQPGPISALAGAQQLRKLRERFEASLVLLEERLAKTASAAPERPYLTTLMVFTKKIELELAGHVEGLVRFTRELEEMHDFIHELYPGEEA